MKAPRQCAILVGGLGTRLGKLTALTPKPLLDCGGRPFLAWIIRELSRFGIEECVLLAGYRSARVEEFSETVHQWLPKRMSIKVSCEPSPAGTGGALWHAKGLLSDPFLLINGDSWVDCNLARFLSGTLAPSDTVAHILLRSAEDTGRYGAVETQANRIVGFREKCNDCVPGLMNCGIYLLARDALEFVTPNCSIEGDVLPVLASKGVLSGQMVDGYFVDIGIPADYVRAQSELPLRLRRSAVFFDRDGVLNEDLGWVGSRDRFHWIDGAKEAIRDVNDMGRHVFVVTNQAGVSRGLYSESDVVSLHNSIARELQQFGATIDDFRYCPYHPDAPLKVYQAVSNWRKPAPGMIDDLCAAWEVTRNGSVLIGDQESDVKAADAASIVGHRFEGGNLLDFVRSRAGLA